MLHVANGESTARLLRAARLDGDILGRDDILMEGPLPNALHEPDDWLARGQHLEIRFGLAGREYAEERLAAESLVAREPDEVVLWSEADLFCQANLLRLLSIATQAARVSLVLPPRDRLGRLDPPTLRRLFDAREPVTPAMTSLAAEAWRAFCEPDPRALLALLDDPRAWPALRDALRLHLARLPDARRGLGLLEQETLLLAGDGETSFGDLFRQLSTSPVTAGFGLGDLQAARVVLDLHATGLLALDPASSAGASTGATLDGATRARLRTTPLGDAVLHGETRAPPLPERHVGGVHLAPGQPQWTWTDGGLALR